MPERAPKQYRIKVGTQPGGILWFPDDVKEGDRGWVPKDWGLNRSQRWFRREVEHPNEYQSVIVDRIDHVIEMVFFSLF